MTTSRNATAVFFFLLPLYSVMFASPAKAKDKSEIEDACQIARSDLNCNYGEDEFCPPPEQNAAYLEMIELGCNGLGLMTVDDHLRGANTMYSSLVYTSNSDFEELKRRLQRAYELSPDDEDVQRELQVLNTQYRRVRLHVVNLPSYEYWIQTPAFGPFEQAVTNVMKASMVENNGHFHGWMMIGDYNLNGFEFTVDPPDQDKRVQIITNKQPPQDDQYSKLDVLAHLGPSFQMINASDALSPVGFSLQVDLRPDSRHWQYQRPNKRPWCWFGYQIYLDVINDPLLETNFGKLGFGGSFLAEQVLMSNKLGTIHGYAGGGAMLGYGVFETSCYVDTDHMVCGGDHYYDVGTVSNSFWFGVPFQGGLRWRIAKSRFLVGAGITMMGQFHMVPNYQNEGTGWYGDDYQTLPITWEKNVFGRIVSLPYVSAGYTW